MSLYGESVRANNRVRTATAELSALLAEAEAALVRIKNDIQLVMAMGVDERAMGLAAGIHEESEAVLSRIRAVQGAKPKKTTETPAP